MSWKATISIRFAPSARGRSSSRGSPAQARTSGWRFFPPWQADQQDRHRPRTRPVRRDRGFRLQCSFGETFWGCPQSVLVRFVLTWMGLYSPAFAAEDALATSRLSPFSRCPRRPEPGPDRRRPDEDPGSPAEVGGNLGNRSTDKPGAQVPFLRRPAAPEVGPRPDQDPALPMRRLPENLFRPNRERHWPHPSSRPVHGGAEGYVGQLRSAIGAQARKAARPQQIHGLALAAGRVAAGRDYPRILNLASRQRSAGAGNGLLEAETDYCSNVPVYRASKEAAELNDRMRKCLLVDGMSVLACQLIRRRAAARSTSADARSSAALPR